MEQSKHTARSRLAMAAGRLREGGSSGHSQGGGARQAGKLDHQAVLLLTVQAMFHTANALSGTFVPIYLYKASMSFMPLGWFALAQHLFSGLTFWIVGKWVKEYNKMNALRAGVLCSGLFYSVVLLLGKSAASYVIPLGMLNGLAMGFFWIAYNVVYFEITEPDNRDRFNGWAGLLGSGSGMLAPWISGLIISFAAGDAGYRIIFSVSLGVFAVAAVFSFFLEKRESVGTYDWLYGVKQLMKTGSPWRQAVPSLMAQGMREGVFIFLLGLLVFLSTGQEKSLGDFTLWTSLVALLSFWLIGRKLHAGNRSKAMLLGTTLIAAVTAIMFVDVGYTTLLLLGIGAALFMPLYVVPMTSAVFDMIGASKESASRREELIVLREAGLIIGRTIGLVIFLFVVSRTTSITALTWLLLGIGSAPILSWIFIRRRLIEQASRVSVQGNAKDEAAGKYTRGSSWSVEHFSHMEKSRLTGKGSGKRKLI